MEYNPQELLEEVWTAIFEEERIQRKAFVRNMIMRQKSLSEEIEKDRKSIYQKEVKLQEVEAKIEKFKSGDWNVLSQFEKSAKDTTTTTTTTP